MNQTPPLFIVNDVIQIPKVKVLEGSGSMLYYHDVKTKYELCSLIACLLQTLSINPSLCLTIPYEGKEAIFKVKDTLYRISFDVFFCYQRYFVSFYLYSLNEKPNLQLTNWSNGFNREDGTEYRFTDIWSTLIKEGQCYNFNGPNEDDEFIPSFPTPSECYQWLNDNSPVFQELLVKLD